MGITGVTPHMFRCTVATVVNEQAGVDLAAELLGHTNTKITIQHYIRRNEMVNHATVELLDRVLAKGERRCQAAKAGGLVPRQ